MGPVCYGWPEDGPPPRAQTTMGTLVGWLLGLVSGVRHAFEPDHVAAVSTLAAGVKSKRRAVSFALTWGLGHAAMLFVVGGFLLTFRSEMPARVSDLFELIVAFALVVLGVRALVQARRRGGSATPHAHVHDGHRHHHGGEEEHVHIRRWTLARGPLIVGFLHGLAGSGAIAALALARYANVAGGLVFLALYGAGAAFGMAALAGLASGPMTTLAKSPKTLTALLLGAGCLSVVFGILWAVPIVSRWSTG